MKLNKLERYEHFIFNHREWKKVKQVPRHMNVFICFDISNQQYRPFHGDVEVEPMQKRIKEVDDYDQNS